MELKILRSFLAIAEDEHFGRAAEKLGIAQPALTRQIQRLEEELGVQVFDRLPRGIRLSVTGQALKREAQRLLADVDRMVAHVQLVGTGKVGVLNLGYVEVASWRGLVPDCIRSFTRSTTDLRVEIAAMSSFDQLAALKQGRLDVGFLYNAPKDDPALLAIHIADHPLALAIHRCSHLIDRDRITLADIANENMIAFSRPASPAYYDALLHEFTRQGLHPRILYEAPNETAMLTLVTGGAGIAIVNGCNRWRVPDGIVLKEIAGLAVTLELSLVCLKDNHSPPLMRFKNWFETEYRDATASGAALN